MYEDEREDDSHMVMERDMDPSPFQAISDMGWDIGISEHKLDAPERQLLEFQALKVRLDAGDLIAGELSDESEEWIDANMEKLEKAFWSGIWRGLVQE